MELDVAFMFRDAGGIPYILIKSIKISVIRFFVVILIIENVNINTKHKHIKQNWY